MGINPRRFLWELPQHLLCPTCKTTLDEGVFVCESRHAFCKPCLYEKGSCPICAGNSLSLHPATDIIDEVGEHWVRCIDPKCSWIGAAKDEKAHTAICEHRVVLCQLCQVPMRQHELAGHLGKVCPEARVVCDHGGEDCGGTGKGIFRRRDGSVHDALCSKFACRLTGCTTRTSLANLAAHEAECLQLRQALVSASQLVGHHQNACKIHHANATVLVDVLAKISRTWPSSINEKEQALIGRATALYPKILELPFASDFVLQPGAATSTRVPLTPVTPSAAGEGTVDRVDADEAPRASAPAREPLASAECPRRVPDEMANPAQVEGPPNGKKRRLSQRLGSKASQISPPV
ncbi:hypothetical protein JCM3766R1_002313 [Sporobolomyces carnicolor]